MTYTPAMYTVVETPTFAADARVLWTEEERGAFCAWPEADDVIPGSGGCHKVRWSRGGIGKRGGVRAIYFTRLANGELWLLVIYAKSVRGSIPAQVLHISRRTLQEWEQGRRQPSGAAQALIRIASRHPATIKEALQA